MGDSRIKYLKPLSDNQKEVIFDVNIERLTPREILEKYGDRLTEDQVLVIKQLFNSELKE